MSQRTGLRWWDLDSAELPIGKPEMSTTEVTGVAGNLFEEDSRCHVMSFGSCSSAVLQIANPRRSQSFDLAGFKVLRGRWNLN